MNDMHWGLLTSLLLLSAIGILATWFASRSNRRVLVLQEKARLTIRDRLTKGPQRSVDMLLLAAEMSIEHHSKAILLLEEIAKVLGVPPEALTFDKSLNEMLRISISDLGEEVGGKEKLPEFFEPFTHDLLHVLIKLSDKRAWEDRWQSNAELPHNEEALADFVMSMTPAQLLSFFAPLISSATTSR